MRLHVVGDAESGAVAVVALAENDIPAAGFGVGRQAEAGLPALGAVESDFLRQDLRTRRVHQQQIERAGGHCRRRARILELAAEELDLHEIAGAVERPVGDGIQLGVVDFAVVVEILGNEDATLRVDAKDVTRFRAGGVEANDTVAAGPARLEHAQAVAPGDFGIGDRRAGLALRHPGQHFAGGVLGDRHAVGDEKQRHRPMLANVGFDQIQAGRALAERNAHVAFVLRQELAAAAVELHALGRFDGFGALHRVAEAVDQIEAGNLGVGGRVAQRRAFAEVLGRFQVGRRLGSSFARIGRKQRFPGVARIRPDFVPGDAQHVGHAFRLQFARHLDAMQVALRLQKRDGIGDAVKGDIDAAVFIDVRRLARNLDADRGFLARAVTRFREQEEFLADPRLIVRGLRRHFRCRIQRRQQRRQQQAAAQRDRNAKR